MSEKKVDILQEISTFSLFVYASGLCLKRYEWRSNQLYLIVVKPDWFFDLRCLQIDEVKTKWLLPIIRDGINCLNGSIESPERAVAGYLYRTARWVDGLLFHVVSPFLGLMVLFFLKLPDYHIAFQKGKHNVMKVLPIIVCLMPLA
jgi:hypothetical protein